jgi:nucleotide-binding universal stress UspA family protein
VTFKIFMVHLDPSADTEGRLKVAAALAQKFEADVIGFSAAETGEPFTMSAGLPAPLLEHHRRQFEECLDLLGQNFLRRGDHLRVQWRAALETPATFAVHNARAADVVIVGRRAKADSEAGFFLPVAPLLMGAGRPVLIIPPGLDALSADRIVVAWKDTRSARVALQQSLPMLMRASQVTVLGVGEEAGEDDLQDVASYLISHGVRAAVRWKGHGGQTVATVITNAVREDGADLIVSGGYGRGSLLEWVLGGVTEELLTQSPYCCLMAH